MKQQARYSPLKGIPSQGILDFSEDQSELENEIESILEKSYSNLKVEHQFMQHYESVVKEDLTRRKELLELSKLEVSLQIEQATKLESELKTVIDDEPKNPIQSKKRKLTRTLDIKSERDLREQGALAEMEQALDFEREEFEKEKRDFEQEKADLEATRLKLQSEMKILKDQTKKMWKDLDYAKHMHNKTVEAHKKEVDLHAQKIESLTNTGQAFEQQLKEFKRCFAVISSKMTEEQLAESGLQEVANFLFPDKLKGAI